MRLLILLLFFSFNASGQVITTICGNGNGALSNDGVLASSAQVYGPACGAFDKYGNYYFSQAWANTVHKIDTMGILHTIAGGGSSGLGDGGLAILASLNYPESLAFDSSGNLYIEDHSNYRIRKVDLSTGIISTYAGSVLGDSGDNGIAIAAKFCPSGICFDKYNNLFITDNTYNKIRKVNTSGIISTFAGTGIAGFSGDNGLALSAQFYTPCTPTIDKNGNLYISDVTNHRVRKIDTSGIITTIAGNGLTSYNGDSILAINAQIAVGQGIAVDSVFNVYIPEPSNGRIRKVNSSGVITTIVGNGVSGYNGDNILATNSQICAGFISIDQCGNFIIPYTSCQRIRKVWFNTDTLPHATVAITPNDTVSTGTQVTTTATVPTGTITGYQWVKNGANASTNSTYTYTPTNGDSVYCIVTVRACTGRTYTDTTQVLHITVTGDAGITNTTNQTTHTYPNPVRDMLNISTKEPQHYLLHNLMGITLLQGTVDKNNSIDMKAISSGIYLLQLTNTQGQREVVRVVKE